MTLTERYSMNLEELAKQVLELDEKATKGPFIGISGVFRNANGTGSFAGGSYHIPIAAQLNPDSKCESTGLLMMRYRAAAPLLAKACLRMKEELRYAFVSGKVDGIPSTLSDVDKLIVAGEG